MPATASEFRSRPRPSQILSLSEVKAQIKLRFHDEAGHNRVLMRSFQLTAAAGKKTTLKALEGVLLHSERDASGAVVRREESMKASATDELLPKLFGVPKPILEHVIFCHQEDSTWPLQEGAALKKRFDEIFATTRYSKAMEDVKKRRKDLHEAVGVARESLAKLRTLNSEAERLRADNARAEAAVRAIDGRRAEAASRVERCEGREATLRGLLAREAEAAGAVEDARRRAEGFAEQAGRLAAQLKEDYESDPDAADLSQESTLREALERAEESLAEARREAEGAESKREALEAEARAAEALAGREREARAGLEGRVVSLLEATREHAAAAGRFAGEHGLPSVPVPEAAGAGSPRKRGREDGSGVLALAEQHEAAEEARAEAAAAFDAASRALLRRVTAEAASAKESLAAAEGRARGASDEARRRLAEAEAAHRRHSEAKAAAAEEEAAAGAALAELGAGAEAEASRELREQTTRADGLSRRAEAEAARDADGAGRARRQLSGSEAVLRRLRRWQGAARKRSVELRGAAEKSTEARVARAAAAEARASVERDLAPMMARCGALGVGAGAAAADGALGLEAAVAAAAREAGVARSRLEGEAASSRAEAAEASAVRGRAEAEAARLRGSMARARATLELADGAGDTLWDADRSRPRAAEEAEERLEEAKEALQEAATAGGRADVVRGVMEQLEGRALKRCACPVCGCRVAEGDEEARERLRATVRSTLRKLMRGLGRPAAAAGGAAGGEVSAAAAQEAADAEVERARAGLEAVRSWAADAAALRGAEQAVEASAASTASKSRAADAAEAGLAEARARCEALAGVVPDLSVLAQRWRAAAEAAATAERLDAELRAAGAGAGGPLRLTPAEEEADADDRAALGEPGAAPEGAAADAAAISALAEAGGDAASLLPRLEDTESRLRLREEELERARREVSERDGRAAEAGRELAEARHAVSRLEARVAEAGRRRERLGAAAAAGKRAATGMAESGRQREAAGAESTRAEAALAAAREAREAGEAKSAARVGGVREALGRIRDAEARRERAARGSPARELRGADARTEEAEAARARAAECLGEVEPRLEAARARLSAAERIKGEVRLLTAYHGERRREAGARAEQKEARRLLRGLRRDVAQGRTAEGGGGEKEEGKEEEEFWGDEDLEEASGTLVRPDDDGEEDEDDGGDEEGSVARAMRERRAAAAGGSSSGSAGARAAKRSFERPDESMAVDERLAKLSARCRRLRDVVAASAGEQRGLAKEQDRREARLASRELSGIGRRVAEATIEERTQALAVKDLDVFYRGLDRALMRYHELMIADVNRSIRDLWNMTYQGSDIDTIEIRSDASDAAVGAAAGKRRSYNYRVVMSKSGTFLDMRGRCSAGQKVLASLIIRLALQQVFAATKCGVLALDEPTTNLDVENKRGFARALAMILQRHASQAHFQLIVITHDVDFVNDLNEAMQAQGAGDCRPEFVFQVRREEHSRLRGKYVSVIKRNAWDKLME